VKHAGLLLALTIASVALPSLAWAADADPQVQDLIRALCGPDAAAEWAASRKLLDLGDGAVPALAQLAGSPGPLAPRLIAIELLGQIGTAQAVDALLSLLPKEKDLALRGQLCMQIGNTRDTRAIPIIAEWIETISPKALDDVPGPKEIQPSTCYIRHVEALGAIGDEAAIPILEQFAKGIPPNIGYGGFISNFLKGAVDQTLDDLRDRQAFWRAVRKQPGLEEKLGPLFAHLRADPLARFRLYEDEVIRRTAQGRAVVERLAKHKDPALAAAAKALVEKFDALAP
jgi:hypothetical protein